MIERINEFAARRFGGVGNTPGSFLRIHAWALAFLVLASVLAPSHLPTLGSRGRFAPVRNLALAYGDQRAYRPSPYGKDRFRIAWVTASEGLVSTTATTTEFVPTIVQRSLPEIDHRKVGIDVYFLPAMRLADVYFSLLDAIATKPDLIVVSLNPVWTMDPVATHQWTQLDAKAALALTTKPSAWPIGAALLSPSDLMWGLASKLEPFRDRSYYSDKIHSAVDDLGPLNRSQLAKVLAAQRPDLYHDLLTSLPLDVWFSYRLHLPRGSLGAANAAVAPLGGGIHVATGAMSLTRWAQWMQTSNRGGNQVNGVLMRAIGKALRDSKIPSYVYLAQVNTEWFDHSAAIRSAVSGVEQQLENLRGAFNAKNIRYQPQTITRFVRPLAFLFDPVHLTRAGAMGPYLADQLCQTLTQSGDSTGCSPRGGSGNGNG